jgi:cysteine desulfurase
VTKAPTSTAVYLDHNATTPIAPEVLDAMRPYLERDFGNPSSAHGYGTAANEAVVRARSDVAMLLGCEPESVVFTASGSEADNLAVKGVALGQRGEGDHVITSAIEHPAVLAACRYLQRRLGYRLTVLPVDGCGVVDPDDVRRAIEPVGLADRLAVFDGRLEVDSPPGAGTRLTATIPLPRSDRSAIS